LQHTAEAAGTVQSKQHSMHSRLPSVNYIRKSAALALQTSAAVQPATEAGTATDFAVLRQHWNIHMSPCLLGFVDPEVTVFIQWPIASIAIIALRFNL
jgi:hypothetical protein